jgi:hypothetical protein
MNSFMRKKFLPTVCVDHGRSCQNLRGDLFCRMLRNTYLRSEPTRNLLLTKFQGKNRCSLAFATKAKPLTRLAFDCTLDLLITAQNQETQNPALQSTP